MIKYRIVSSDIQKDQQVKASKNTVTEENISKSTYERAKRIYEQHVDLMERLKSR